MPDMVDITLSPYVPPSNEEIWELYDAGFGDTEVCRKMLIGRNLREAAPKARTLEEMQLLLHDVINILFPDVPDPETVRWQKMERGKAAR